MGLFKGKTAEKTVYVRMLTSIVGDNVTPLKNGDERREMYSYGIYEIVKLPAGDAERLIKAGQAEETVKLRPVCKLAGKSEVQKYIATGEWELATE